MEIKKETPWWWVPTLYVAEGLPYFAVNTLTVIMYTNMGVSLRDMTFFTGWLYLPWVIKPFWSPFVDLFKTKRWWILTMQMTIAIMMAGIALFIPGRHFFTITLIFFWLSAFFSATHDISADGLYLIGLDSHQQAAFVGVRSTFYRIASIAGQGGLVLLAGYLETTLQNIPLAWSYVFGLLSAIFFIFTLYHLWSLPRTGKDRPIEGVDRKNIIKDFFRTFITFFRKKHIVIALLFMLLYRFPEALCLKIIQPFFLASREIGGLGLTTAQAGLVNGTIGVVGLLIGGIVGGVAISRGGLKKLLFPMAASLTLPCIFYCFLAMWQPTNFLIISGAIFIEQFGYGFGFSAYMLYLLYFSRGEAATSHYAFCTAFMAIGMMLPGMGAGWIFEYFEKFEFFASSFNQGYINFFWLVVLSSLLTFLVCGLLKIDPEFGKKKREE
ncbi:MAG: MFS transporter [Muribaculaceae bacterium]|nr:MFS transporter [Muribaculaceae bacterium]